MKYFSVDSREIPGSGDDRKGRKSLPGRVPRRLSAWSPLGKIRQTQSCSAMSIARRELIDGSLPPSKLSGSISVADAGD